jgi:hypothetical protein
MYLRKPDALPPVTAAKLTAEVSGLSIEGIATETIEAACPSSTWRSLVSLCSWIEEALNERVAVMPTNTTSTTTVSQAGSRLEAEVVGCAVSRAGDEAIED